MTLALASVVHGMTDDIVTQLKSIADLDEAIGGTVIPVMCREAADEIEQLRKDVRFQARVISRHYEQFSRMHKEIERLRAVLENTWKLLDAVQECLNPHDCEFCTAKSKAVRDV